MPVDKMTAAQKTVYNKMESGRWYSAYDLKCSLATLRALCNLDYLQVRYGLGNMFFPRTNIEYRRKNASR
jgi:hypothetical protein